ncbi:MAG: hypothetical protein WC655_09370, partial [Candidatus Hydrogenedentales bacterium]
MTKLQTLLIGFLAAAIAYGFAFALKPPAPRYYPIEHTWSMADLKLQPVTMWYGRSAVSLGIAALAGLVAAGLAARIAHRPFARPTVAVLTTLLFVALGLTAAFIVY